MEKAGWLKLEKDKGRVTPVKLTPKGELLLQQIAGVQKTQEKDNTTRYKVRLRNANWWASPTSQCKRQPAPWLSTPGSGCPTS